MRSTEEATAVRAWSHTDPVSRAVLTMTHDGAGGGELTLALGGDHADPITLRVVIDLTNDDYAELHRLVVGPAVADHERETEEQAAALREEDERERRKYAAAAFRVTETRGAYRTLISTIHLRDCPHSTSGRIGDLHTGHVTDLATVLRVWEREMARLRASLDDESIARRARSAAQVRATGRKRDTAVVPSTARLCRHCKPVGGEYTAEAMRALDRLNTHAHTDDVRFAVLDALDVSVVGALTETDRRHQADRDTEGA